MGITQNPYFNLHVLFLCFSLINHHLSHGADTISGNQSLSGDQTIVSAGGKFRLGFFTPGNSSKSYIGMWYNQVSVQTIVWVANRENPISDKHSSQLKILDGNLVLLDESKTLIWSTNLRNPQNSNSLEAVLLDDGNFVLTNGPNSTNPLWQSFDYPTDTFLPGSKIGFNKITNSSQLLTSWKNSEDPSPGLFSLELDPNGSQYMIRWNGSEQYWSSGPWNGHIFSLIPEMRLNYIYNFSYVSNVNESYFTYSLYNPEIISRCILDLSGQIKQLTWLESSKQWNLFWSQPRRQCDVYAYCGAFGTCNGNNIPFCECLTGFEPKSLNDWDLFDFSGGCVRKTGLQCESNGGKLDGFLINRQMGLPEHSQLVPVRSAMECASNCSNNCSCTAYAYEGSECSIWFGELLNIKQLSVDDSDGKTLYIKLAASEISSPKSNKGIVIGLVVGLVAVILLLACPVFFVLRRRKGRLVRSVKFVEGSLVAFGYQDLQSATKSFSEKLGGGGGFGSVFKGTLPDSTIMVVKKLKSVNQREKQFRRELSTIGTIQHVNLVQLRGFCSERNKKFLVYDYMPNGSLDSHLFSESLKVLDWKMRYQIALGIAKGLAYLHEKCKECIIHCDIKPENVLLDAEFRPKVTDFGLAKLIGQDFSGILRTMRGTRGYLAPEWISGVPITDKADVYSYGMMLFEILSGRRNSERSEDGKAKFFPYRAATVLKEGGDVLSLPDRRLQRGADEGEVKIIGRVACWCIQDDENHRPSMAIVVLILEGVLEVNRPPIPQSLQEHTSFLTESSSSQTSKEQRSHSASFSLSKSTTSSSSKS